jgi:hypothetical protein
MPRALWIVVADAWGDVAGVEIPGRKLVDGVLTGADDHVALIDVHGSDGGEGAVADAAHWYTMRPFGRKRSLRRTLAR